MRCPVCTPTQPLWAEPLDGALTARLCAGCGGRWIRTADYWRWRAQHASSSPAACQSSPIAMPAVHETTGLKYCPEDQYILAHYRVGHGVPFTLDRCRHCEGIWLDRGEWEVLNERGLHDDLHQIFTEQWQKQIKEEEHRAREEAHWLRVLGEADYAKVREVKAWLDSHPERVWLMEYLKLEQHSSRGSAKS